MCVATHISPQNVRRALASTAVRTSLGGRNVAWVDGLDAVAVGVEDEGAAWMPVFDVAAGSSGVELPVSLTLGRVRGRRCLGAGYAPADSLRGRCGGAGLSGSFVRSARRGVGPPRIPDRRDARTKRNRTGGALLATLLVRRSERS